MKKLIFSLGLIFAVLNLSAQFTYKIKADSVLITNDSCTAELIIENSTKGIKGFLVNKGGGRTEFRRAVRLSDSSFTIGADTIVIQGASGNTIYSGNGTLSGMRTISMNGHSIGFTGGNIGIGTTVPTQALHVKGKVQIDTISTGSATDSVLVTNKGLIQKVARSTLRAGEFVGNANIFGDIPLTNGEDEEILHVSLSKGVWLITATINAEINGSIVFRLTDGITTYTSSYFGGQAGVVSKGAITLSYCLSTSATKSIFLYATTNGTNGIKANVGFGNTAFTFQCVSLAKD